MTRKSRCHFYSPNQGAGETGNSSGAEFGIPSSPFIERKHSMHVRVSTDDITTARPFRIYVQHEYGVNYIDVEP